MEIVGSALLGASMTLLVGVIFATVFRSTNPLNKFLIGQIVGLILAIIILIFLEMGL